MHPIVIEYVQLVCVAFLFDNLSCDNLSLEASRNDLWLNREASCMAVCMENNLTAILIDCHGKCLAIKRTSNSTETISNEKIQLICQDSDSITIEIEMDDHRNNNEINITNSRKFNGNLYMIRVQESKRENPLKIVCIADTPIITIGNLTNNTEYNITASIFTGNSKHRHLPNMETFKTLSNDKYIPASISVEAITVEYILTNDSLRPSTLIRWKSDDLVCKYGFGFFDKSAHNKKPPIYMIFSDPKQLNLFKSGPIEFNNTYQLKIVGLNTKDNCEGKSITYNFTTPTCHKFYESNLTVCPPLDPENIRTSHVLTSQHSYYKINVEWDLPASLPDEYNVSLYFNNSPDVWQNVSGTEVNVTFDGVHSRDPTYDVGVMAISKGGNGTAYIRDANLTSYVDMFDRYQSGIRIVKFVIPVLVLFIILLITLHVKYRPKLSAKELFLRQMARAHKNDSMEVIPTDVEIQGVIGEGAFGIVKKGILKPFNKPVAVKMLKENASPDDVEGFLREITLMKSVRKHVNIVGIVGHCVSDYKNMMLLTEYCSAGNLLEYLRFYQKTGRIERINSVIPIVTEFMPKCKMGSYDSFFENRSAKSDQIQMEVFSNKSEPLNRLTTNSVMNKLYDEFDSSIKCVESLSYESEPNRGMYVVTTFNNHASDRKTDPKMSKPPLLVENQCYDLFQSPQNFTAAQIINCNKIGTDLDEDFDTDGLCSEDLLRFAKQIAIGMEFLSNCKIVHRDLAARNVLVCADKTVKIADFGLSRDIYKDDVYMKATTGRLPIKWLAIESMAKQEYTTKSDVWSFGILCYEIVTLGDTPYPDVSADELLEHLKSGKRLRKPDTCSDEFYQMMFTCWYDDPKLRPTFAELTQDINKFITECKDFGAFVINVLNRKQSLDRTSSSNSTAYLRPISDIN